MLTIPSIDLVGVDVAITIEDEVFDKDLENKSSTRYKTLEQQVEKEVKSGNEHRVGILYIRTRNN